MQNITCESCLDWLSWLNKAKNYYYDVIILDINLPWLSWIEVLKEIRKSWIDTQIIILTSNSSKKRYYTMIKYLSRWLYDKTIWFWRITC